MSFSISFHSNAPGAQGGFFGGQTQHPPPQQIPHVQQQPSQHYGAYQQTHQTNVFGAAAWQVCINKIVEFLISFDKLIYKEFTVRIFQNIDFATLRNTIHHICVFARKKN